LFVAGIGFLLGADNSTPVELNLFGWQSPRVSIFIWVVSALILGIILGATLTRIFYFGRRLVARKPEEV